MIELQFSLEGQEVIHRRLDIAIDQATDLSKPFKQVGKNFIKTFDKNFSARGGLYGGWAPRKPQYRKGRRYDTWPLLEKTGRMRKSFQSTVGRDSLKIGNTASYFKYHQSNQPRTRLPRRVMMQLRAEDATMIVKEVQYAFMESLQGRKY